MVLGSGYMVHGFVGIGYLVSSVRVDGFEGTGTVYISPKVSHYPVTIHIS